MNTIDRPLAPTATGALAGEDTAPGPRSPLGRTTAALVVWGGVIGSSFVWGRWLIERGQQMFLAAAPLAGHLRPIVNP